MNYDTTTTTNYMYIITHKLWAMKQTEQRKTKSYKMPTDIFYEYKRNNMKYTYRQRPKRFKLHDSWKRKIIPATTTVTSKPKGKKEKKNYGTLNMNMIYTHNEQKWQNEMKWIEEEDIRQKIDIKTN